MGRLYTGDIEGKFWFGVQDSDDIENLITIKGITDYYWKVCNCIAEIDHDHYCRDCFETKEEHIEATIEDEEYQDKCLYYEDSSHGYSVDKDIHYNELIKNMESLKKEIPIEIISEFDKIEQNDKILDAFSGVFNNMNNIITSVVELDKERHNMRVLVARYTLGYQIEYCLRNTDSCNINCEY